MAGNCTSDETHRSDIIRRFSPNLGPYEEIYKDIHRHPELSTQESRTAKIAADHLEQLGYSVRRAVGGHGVVGVIENGDGPAVLLRADMDALPIEEKTGLPYASKARMTDTDGIEKPVSHACGHDMHVTCLMAAAELLRDARSAWKGRLILLFQPNEERGHGAQAMVDDGLYGDAGIPKPDIVLGQHVVNIRSGSVATRKGACYAGKTAFEVVIFGRGGHGATPHFCIDPVVIAAHIIVRLQTIVSREIDPNKTLLITCGSVQAGDAPNVIPDKAVLKVDIRAYDPDILQHAVTSFRRVVHAECEASGASQTPSITQIEHVPPLVCDDDLVAAITSEFQQFFGKSNTERMSLGTAADDFSVLAPDGVPYAYWNIGSEDPEKWQDAATDAGAGAAAHPDDQGRRRLDELPSNHSPYYAPVVQPTLQTGTHALALAALTFLAE